MGEDAAMVEVIFMTFVLVLSVAGLTDKGLAWVIAATLGESDESDSAA